MSKKRELAGFITSDDLSKPYPVTYFIYKTAEGHQLVRLREDSSGVEVVLNRYGAIADGLIDYQGTFYNVVTAETAKDKEAFDEWYKQQCDKDGVNNGRVRYAKDRPNWPSRV